MNPIEVMHTDHPGFSDFENQGPVHDENALSADSVGSEQAASSLLAAAVDWGNQAQEPTNPEPDLEFLDLFELLSPLGVASSETVAQVPPSGDHAVPDRYSSLDTENSRRAVQQDLLSDVILDASTVQQVDTRGSQQTPEEMKLARERKRSRDNRLKKKQETLQLKEAVKKLQLKVAALISTNEVLSKNMEIAKADLEIYKIFSGFQKEEIAELREEKRRYGERERQQCPQCSFGLQCREHPTE